MAVSSSTSLFSDFRDKPVETYTLERNGGIKSREYTLAVSYKVVAVPTTVWERFCNWLGKQFNQDYRFMKVMQVQKSVVVPEERSSTRPEVLVQRSHSASESKVDTSYDSTTKTITIAASSDVVFPSIRFAIVRENALSVASSKETNLALENEICKKLDFNLYPKECHSFIKKEYIPKLLAARMEALKIHKAQIAARMEALKIHKAQIAARMEALKIHKAQREKGIVKISSKSYGLEAHADYRTDKGVSKWLMLSSSIRVLPDGSTLIAVPGGSMLGGMKKVTVLIRISADASSVEIDVVSKLQKEMRTASSMRQQEEVQAIAATFNHRHILSPKMVIKHPKKGIEAVSEKCETDFRSFLIETRNQSTPDKKKVANDLIGYIGNIASGMKYIYDRGYLHNDIKPGNVFMKKEGDMWVPKIADFDFLLTTKQGNERTNPQVFGTPGYCPPDVARKDIHSELFALAQMISCDKSKGTESLHPDAYISVCDVLDRHIATLTDGELKTHLQAKREALASLAEQMRNKSISTYEAVIAQLSSLLPGVAISGGGGAASSGVAPEVEASE